MTSDPMVTFQMPEGGRLQEEVQQFTAPLHGDTAEHATFEWFAAASGRGDPASRHVA